MWVCLPEASKAMITSQSLDVLVYPEIIKMAFEARYTEGMTHFIGQVITLVKYSMAERLQSDIQSSLSLTRFLLCPLFCLGLWAVCRVMNREQTFLSYI